MHHAVLNQPYAIEPALDLQSLPPAATAPERLRSIWVRLPRATGQPAAVPIDEQDRPVLNVPQEHKNARTSRNRPGDVYRILKDAGERIRVVFVTGITMVAEAGFPSGLNSLTDISLYPPLAAICAYTDHGLDAVAAPELDWTGTGAAPATTATTGWARRSPATRTTFSTCSMNMYSGATGSCPKSPAACTGC